MVDVCLEKFCTPPLLERWFLMRCSLGIRSANNMLMEHRICEQDILRI